jgi:DNA sulfur modification protein DndB
LALFSKPYCTYAPESNYFNAEKISHLAQIDWSRENPIWHGNVIRIDPNPKNPEKPYKMSTTANAAMDAVKAVKFKLGWVNPSY